MLPYFCMSRLVLCLDIQKYQIRHARAASPKVCFSEESEVEVCVQDHVSDDMVGLSSQLLANVRAMQGAVQAREGLLSEAEVAQDASLANADYAVKTSKNIKNRCALQLEL